MNWPNKIIGLCIFALIAIGDTKAESLQTPDCCWDQCSLTSAYLPDCDSRVYFYGDALFFKPHENGLAYGMIHSGAQFVDAVTFSPTGETKTRIKSPDFKWDTGFRIGAGYYPQCSCLEFSTHWVHYRGSANDSLQTSAKNGEGDFFVGTWSNFVEPIYLQFLIPIENETVSLDIEANADLKFRLDMVDVEAGYEINPTNCFCIKPRLGIRIGAIDQTYNLCNEFFGRSQAASVFTKDSSKEKIRITNNFSGAGLLFGLDADYQIGCGFSFVGSVTAALLKGHFKIHENYYADISSRTTGDSFESNVRAKQKERLELQRAIADFELGILWTSSINDCLGFWVKLAWEQHLYFGQNQIRALAISQDAASLGIAQSNRGDLGLQGISLSAGVEF